ncbi:hypothetical protein DDZ16_13720 [Marinilabilia rubra]|uniref:Uncharacterized protein n=2 Tax=Marinilabilia rubra TaxID=2162893 RepID=A0A2U2B6X3_9BACT|nr:hypothetical protein DDZ16_13720 [Marinilabilia rubra]
MTFLLIGCSKNNDTIEKEDPSIVLWAYKGYFDQSYPYPSNFSCGIFSCSKSAAKFYFYDAKDITSEIQKDEFHYDVVYPHDKKSETFDLLTKENGKLKLDNGSIIDPITIKTKTHYSSNTPGEIITREEESDYAVLLLDVNNSDQYNDVLTENIVLLPEGEYYIVAVNSDLKYSGKFITVSHKMIDNRFNIVFPVDSYYDGYFDWIELE